MPLLIQPSGLSAPKTFAESSINTLAARQEDIAWRVLKNTTLGRELDPWMRTNLIRMSFRAFVTNPFAKRLIEMQVNFVLGNGITLTSTKKDILKEVYQWWTDPYNHWAARVNQRLRDLYIYGELLHRPLIEQGTGFVRIADVQPDKISGLRPWDYDHGVIDKIILAGTYDPLTGETTKDVTVDAIRHRLNERTFAIEKGPSGSLFYFGINRTTDTLRGIGELFPLLDYLDIYDDILISRAEKIRSVAHFFWDLKLEGMSEEEMKKHLAMNPLPPKPGSVYAHNEHAEINVKTANLHADDHHQDVSVLKSHIVAMSGWPGTWFDDPGSAGRAVGAEMAEPALRNVVNLQAQFVQILRDEITYHLWQRMEAGQLDTTPEELMDPGLFVISCNRPSTRDIQRIGPALARLSTFIGDSRKNNLLTQEEARALVVSQIQQLGISDAPISMELPVQLVKDAKQSADAQIAKAAAKVVGQPDVKGQPAAIAKETLEQSVKMLLTH